MSVREETAALAVELGRLVTSRSSRTLDPDELAVALIARRDTLRLMRQILLAATGQPHTQGPRDRTGTGTPSADLSISYLEDRPVAALLRTLTTVPLPTTHTDIPPAPIDAGGGWPQIRRHAALADHEWSQRAPTPTGDARWSAVADVAAITHAVALLDQDLLVAARAHPRPDPDVVNGLTRSTISGLRVAAVEAGTTARTGPLPDWQTPGPERHPTRALVVRSPGHIVAAQKRLAALITSTEALGPRAVTQLADGQARFLTTAAQALARVDPTRAQHATVLAAALRNSLRSSPHTLASLTPDDPTPMTQTRSLLLAVAVAGSRGWDDPEALRYLSALARGTDAARDVVTALAGRARHELHSGRWLIPNDAAEAAGDFMWRRARPKEWGRNESESAPSLLRALETAATLAASLPPPRRVPEAGDDRVVTPREALADLNVTSRDRPHAPNASISGSGTTAADQLGPDPTDADVATPTVMETAAQSRERPAQRWAGLAEQLDPRLTGEADWPATAGALQLVHDHGHDVPAITRRAVASGPLGDHPAQDLRYRLAPMLDPVSLALRDRAQGRSIDTEHASNRTAGAGSSPDPAVVRESGSGGARVADRHPAPAGSGIAVTTPAR